MNTKLTSGLFGFAALLMASQVNAATVQISPANTRVVVGLDFSLTVQGIDFTLTAGGGISLAWDPDHLVLINSALALDQQLINNEFHQADIFIAPGRLDMNFSKDRHV